MKISDKWANGIFAIATGSRFRRNLMTPLGFVMFLVFITCFVLLSDFLDSILKLPFFPGRPLNLVIGIPVLSAGTILALTCVIFFLINKGTPVPLNPPPVLIDKGPYAYSRNPMIAGLLLVFFGYGILSGSISLAFIITPLFAVFNVIELKRIEEPELEKRLGEAYLEYKKKVPMFFPAPGKRA